MARRARSIQGGLVDHVLNRSHGRHPIIRNEADDDAFELVLEEVFDREPLRILAYCVLPNHWHFVVWPKQGADHQASGFGVQRPSPWSPEKAGFEMSTTHQHVHTAETTPVPFSRQILLRNYLHPMKSV